MWGDDWAIGMSGEITEVPVGFAHETIIVAGTGVTETMDRYVLTTLPPTRPPLYTGDETYRQCPFKSAASEL